MSAGQGWIVPALAERIGTAPPSGSLRTHTAASVAAPDALIEDLRIRVLPRIDAEDLSYDHWREVLMALKSTGHPDALRIAHEWSAGSPRYSTDEVEAKWASFKRTGITVARLYVHAKVAPWKASGLDEFEALDLPDAPAAVERVITAPSDVDLANELSAELGDRYHYCGGRWLGWDGQRYAPDETGVVMDRVRAHIERRSYSVRGEMLAAGKPEHVADRAKVLIGSAKTVRAVESLMRVHRVHASAPSDFDSDAMLLNNRDGVYGLANGVLVPHWRRAKCTKVAAAGVGDQCPVWRRFIEQLTGGDTALAEYLQKSAGYFATGSVREHIFWIIYGRGGTGKSTFIETLADVLGDYAGTADASLFTRGSESQHPTGLAGLRGKRLVVAPELEQGSHWNEALIKGITGGDRISARFMRADYFEFQPQCKLVFVGNFRPHLRNVEDGIKRRTHLLEFDRKPQVVDKDLRSRLALERDGILGWILQGTAMWLAEGLSAPAAVRSATEDYFESEDDIGRWLSEGVENHPDGFVESVELFQAYRQWVATNGGYTGTQKRLSADLQRRGYSPGKDPKSRRAGFYGVRLRHPFVAGDCS